MKSIQRSFASIILFGVLLALPATGALAAETSPVDAASQVYPGMCSPWEQVNQGGFGLPSNFDAQGNLTSEILETPYNNEENFGTAVFKGQLYLGMEADNVLGARLWRTIAGIEVPRRQADWQEVASNPQGYPFGVADTAQVDHIDSLAVFRDSLYVATANRSGNPVGVNVFRSTSGDPDSWEDALANIGPGFGDPANENFKAMLVYKGWLCGGTINMSSGTELWCTPNGQDWYQRNAAGFGDPLNIVTFASAVFDDHLYVGVQNAGTDSASGSDDSGRLYRTDSLSGIPVWTEVYNGGPGSAVINLLGELQGYLYIGHRTQAGLIILRSPDGSPGSWQVVSQPGMNFDPYHVNVRDGGALVYNDTLYVSVLHGNGYTTLWRTIGEETADGGLVWYTDRELDGFQTESLYAQLISFNGYLYAWTTNYQLGQKVWQALCPVCQRVQIEGPGLYEFEAVSASLNFSHSALQSVEICAYADVLPPLTGDPETIRRFYTVEAYPANARFNATVTLGYTQAEKQNSVLAGDRHLAVSSWQNSEWQTCPQGSSSNDLALGTVSCANLDSFPQIWVVTRPGTAIGYEAGLVALGLLLAILGLATWINRRQ